MDAGTKLGGGGGDAPGILLLTGGTPAPGGENPANPGGVAPGGRKGGGKGGRVPDDGGGNGGTPDGSEGKPGGNENPGLLLKM